jgi:NDP-sugar pyrophosphorylase family protein
MKKAMLFAAGMGTRLKPLTDIMPKALVPVNGTPLLKITLDRLISFGFNEIVINVHHFSEQIVKYLAEHKFDAVIKISDESDLLLETGGGLKKALSLFSEGDSPILLHNVDILSNANLDTFYEDSKGKTAHLMVSQRKTNRYLLFDDRNRLFGWHNTATGEIKTPYTNIKTNEYRSLAFSGIHCISPQVKALMQEWPDKFSIIDFYLSICKDAHVFCTEMHDLNLLDVGKQDTLKTAEFFLSQHYKNEQ